MNSSSQTHRVEYALLPHGWAADVSVEVNGAGTILNVSQGSSSSDPVHRGVLLPGLINAHTHLEQAWRTSSVPGGDGFVEWAKGLRSEVPPEQRRTRLTDVARTMRDLGTAAVSDIAGWEDVFQIWSDVGMQGIIQREFLGFGESSWPTTVETVNGFMGRHKDGLWERPAAHAPYSTPPELLRATLRHSSPGPGSIHVAEDLDELEFLLNGEGGFAQWMDEMNIDWRWWSPPGQRTIHYLSELDVLGPSTLAVHGVHLSQSECRLLADTGTPLCLCPRSNLHIGGKLPDVKQLLDANVQLCLGTDSLASCPDLDVLAEVLTLSKAFPSIPALQWVQAATQGGADALGLSHLGRIQKGAKPGLLLLKDCPSPESLEDTVVGTRVWLVQPGVAK